MRSDELQTLSTCFAVVFFHGSQQKPWLSTSICPQSQTRKWTSPKLSQHNVMENSWKEESSGAEVIQSITWWKSGASSSFGKVWTCSKSVIVGDHVWKSIFPSPSYQSMVSHLLSQEMYFSSLAKDASTIPLTVLNAPKMPTSKLLGILQTNMYLLSCITHTLIAVHSGTCSCWWDIWISAKQNIQEGDG